MEKEFGRPFDTPFIDVDEAETSFSLALFPEMNRLDKACDNETIG